MTPELGGWLLEGENEDSRCHWSSYENGRGKIARGKLQPRTEAFVVSIKLAIKISHFHAGCISGIIFPFFSQLKFPFKNNCLNIFQVNHKRLLRKMCIVHSLNLKIKISSSYFALKIAFRSNHDSSSDVVSCCLLSLLLVHAAAYRRWWMIQWNWYLTSPYFVIILKITFFIPFHHDNFAFFESSQHTTIQNQTRHPHQWVPVSIFLYGLPFLVYGLSVWLSPCAAINIFILSLIHILKDWKPLHKWSAVGLPQWLVWPFCSGADAFPRATKRLGWGKRFLQTLNLQTYAELKFIF